MNEPGEEGMNEERDYTRRAQPVFRVDQRFGNVLVKPRYFYSLGEALDYCEASQAEGWRLKVTDVTPEGI